MSSSEARAKLMELDNSRKSLEEELKAHLDVLKSNGNVGMDDPLVDAEDFPRNDIDVYQVRHARTRINRLLNDLRKIMAQIESGVNVIHDKSRTEGNGTNCASNRVVLPLCFAAIDLVTEGSPAAQDGLKVGDRVAVFGSVNADNFGALSDVGKETRQNQGKEVRVKVVRNWTEERPSTAEVVTVKLVPREWSGRGLLGCNIVPLAEPSAER